MKDIIFMILFVGVGALSLVACGGKTSHAPAKASSVYEVKDAVITRIAGAKGPAKGTASITLEGLDSALVSASSPQAEAIEIHTMEMDGNMMKMRKVDSLPVTESAPLILGPKGEHLMVYGLDEALKTGDTVDLLLTFRNADGLEDTLAVEARMQVVGE